MLLTASNKRHPNGPQSNLWLYAEKNKRKENTLLAIHSGKQTTERQEI